MKTNISPRPFFRLFGFLAGIVVFASCNVAYIPSMHNVPLFKKEGDVEVNLSTANFQGAYAVTNNVGIMVNGQIGGNSGSESNSGNSNYSASRRFIEGGVGYYHYDIENKSFEVYAGGGVGSVRFDDSWDYSTTAPQKYSARATKFFIQPSIGMSQSFFDFAFALKAVSLQYYSISTENYTEENLIQDNLYKLDSYPFIFLEPSFTFRGGWKYIKGQFQFLYCTKVTGTNINYQGLNLLFGVSLRF